MLLLACFSSPGRMPNKSLRAYRQLCRCMLACTSARTCSRTCHTPHSHPVHRRTPLSPFPLCYPATHHSRHNCSPFGTRLPPSPQPPTTPRARCSRCRRPPHLWRVEYVLLLGPLRQHLVGRSRPDDGALARLRHAVVAGVQHAKAYLRVCALCGDRHVKSWPWWAPVFGEHATASTAFCALYAPCTWPASSITDPTLWRAQQLWVGGCLVRTQGGIKQSRVGW